MNTIYFSLNYNELCYIHYFGGKSCLVISKVTPYKVNFLSHFSSKLKLYNYSFTY